MATDVHVVNTDGFIRSPSSGVIINTNEDQYQLILQARERAKEAQVISDKLKYLETELSTIKTLLVEIINGRTHV